MDMEKRWAELEKGFDEDELKARGWKKISSLLDDLDLSDNEQEFILDNYDCFDVEDAIREFADTEVSVYTVEQLAYFENHEDSVDEAIENGYIDSNSLKITCADDVTSIQAQLGAVAWFYDVFTELEGSTSLAQAALYLKAQNEFGRNMLSPDEAYAIETYCDSDDFGYGWNQAIENEFMDEVNMFVENLSYDELDELAAKMIDEANQEKGEGTSYVELLSAYDTVGLDAIIEKYQGVNFCVDDFVCNQEDLNDATENTDERVKQANKDNKVPENKGKDER